jgi:hypothetical protein
MAYPESICAAMARPLVPVVALNCIAAIGVIH